MTQDILEDHNHLQLFIFTANFQYLHHAWQEGFNFFCLYEEESFHFLTRLCLDTSQGSHPKAPPQQGGFLEQSPHILTLSPNQAIASHSAPAPGCPNTTLLTISALSDSPTRTSSIRNAVTTSGCP